MVTHSAQQVVCPLIATRANQTNSGAANIGIGFGNHGSPDLLIHTNGTIQTGGFQGFFNGGADQFKALNGWIVCELYVYAATVGNNILPLKVIADPTTVQTTVELVGRLRAVKRETNIGFAGSIGAGKSELINTAVSTLEDCVVEVDVACQKDTHVTSNYNYWELRNTEVVRLHSFAGWDLDRDSFSLRFVPFVNGALPRGCPKEKIPQPEELRQGSDRTPLDALVFVIAAPLVTNTEQHERIKRLIDIARGQNPHLLIYFAITHCDELPECKPLSMADIPQAPCTDQAKIDLCGALGVSPDTVFITLAHRKNKDSLAGELSPTASLLCLQITNVDHNNHTGGCCSSK
eukprot:TRINITY_DN5773_c0_g1_i1.p1 TRINITY_DN5773_c0_g1~~TRINITY_DN5773_c0_g1_i1.p1  ORF type:complete len:348 (+),score=47.56 TRINITY_DN5773_c0_g1_i1:217-1260(+)